jgi:deoxyribonuclease V
LILAFDTYYFDNKAKTVCLCFDDWAASEPASIYSEILEGIEPYIPGKFYQRELPCILSLFHQVNTTDVDAIIVDGYVYINDKMDFGLGGHLYAALQQTIPVIGVAKSNFKTLDKFKFELFRGDSTNPLYISAIGIEMNKACHYVASMHGPYRFPTLLKSLDYLTKTF